MEKIAKKTNKKEKQRLGKIVKKENSRLEKLVEKEKKQFGED